MTQNLIIISAGKQGREFFPLISQVIAAGAPWRIKGFLDDRADQLRGFDYPVGIVSSVEAYVPKKNDLFVCAIGDPMVRRRLCEQISKKGGKFATVIHPTAILGHNVALETGAVICAFASVGSDVSLGRFTFVGSNSILGHDTKTAGFCQFSGSCILGGNVRVEEMCFFGLGAKVVPGVRIGKQAYVGIGSVVLKGVRAGAKVFGNPAVEIDC